jgi:hypothetical protein
MTSTYHSSYAPQLKLHQQTRIKDRRWHQWHPVPRRELEALMLDRSSTQFRCGAQISLTIERLSITRDCSVIMCHLVEKFGNIWYCCSYKSSKTGVIHDSGTWKLSEMERRFKESISLITIQFEEAQLNPEEWTFLLVDVQLTIRPTQFWPYVAEIGQICRTLKNLNTRA